MMTKHYIAVTYDVCEHNDLCEDMNEYILDSSADMDKQVKEFAKIDIAPLIRVYESATSDFNELTLYEEYQIKEYECGCDWYYGTPLLLKYRMRLWDKREKDTHTSHVLSSFICFLKRV